LPGVRFHLLPRNWLNRPFVELARAPRYFRQPGIVERRRGFGLRAPISSAIVEEF
jgi:hypothetical protein